MASLEKSQVVENEPACPSASEEIQPHEIKMIECIGEGTTATVFLAMYKGQQVAVKEIRSVQEGRIDASTLQAVQRELRVLSQVAHPNILRFIGLVSDCFRLRFVLEYCSGGSLFELLHNHWDVPITWAQRVNMLCDTASASAYLHSFSPPVLHRDLKSLNLMLKTEFNSKVDTPPIKLADFGYARVYERAMTQCVGTKHWMAPEVLMSTVYTSKADVFSFAMVVFEVCCRHVPFETLDPTAVAAQLMTGVRPDLTDPAIVPKQTPPQLLKLAAACWAQEPSDRPSFDEIFDILNELLQSIHTYQV